MFGWICTVLVVLLYDASYVEAVDLHPRDALHSRSLAEHRKPPSMTSLEALFTRSYNELVVNGKWSQIFGPKSSNSSSSATYDISEQSYCIGSPEIWPLPGQLDPNRDLQKVLNRGIFRCAYLQNVNYEVYDSTSGTNRPLIVTDSNHTASGMVVDWWDALAEQASQTVNVLYNGTYNITVEWNLYPTSQAALEAVYVGQADAACGYWAPDGSFTPPSSSNVTVPKVERSVSFHRFTCPTVSQQKYIYTLASDSGTGSITTFDELITAFNNGQISSTSICVTGSPNGGFATSCQNTFDQYATNNVTCEGLRSASFDGLQTGQCFAVWDGVPNVTSRSLYNMIPMPAPYYWPTSFFRQDDLRNDTMPPGSGSVPPALPNGVRSSKTTLELAFTRAYEQLVFSGVSKEYFNSDVQGITNTSYCTGDYELWPMPSGFIPTNPDGTPDITTDLQAVLDRKVFRCGYAMNQVFTSPDGQHAYIDTTNPPQVVGLVPDYWARLVQTLGEMYNTSLSLEWILTASSSSTFAALYDGEIDSACGYWSAQAPWNSSSGLISRAYDFSLMACPTFLQASYVYAPVVSGIDSISSLSAAIDATNGSYPICVTDDPTSGTVNRCESILGALSPGQVECIGNPFLSIDPVTWAYQALGSGDCNVVYGGGPSSAASLYNSFSVSRNAPSSFFRTFDVGETPLTPAPTPGPAPPDVTTTVTSTSTGTGTTTGTPSTSGAFTKSTIFLTVVIAIVSLSFVVAEW